MVQPIILNPQQIISVKTGQEFSIRVDIFEITDDLYVENLLNAVWLVDYDRGLLELIDEEHFYLLVDGHNVEERAIYTFKALVAGNGEVIATYKSLWEVPGFIDFVFDQVFSVHIIS
jgi:hypothetical protein